MKIDRNTPICLFRYGRQCRDERTKFGNKYCLKTSDCEYKEPHNKVEVKSTH